MKVLFMCRGNRTPLMMELAKKLKQDNIAEETHGLNLHNEDCWMENINNKYNNVLDEIYSANDIFHDMKHKNENLRSSLERYEKKYLIETCFWNTVFTDRYITSMEHFQFYDNPKYTDDDVLNYIDKNFELTEKILKNESYDAIFGISPLGLTRGTVNVVAKKLGIPYFIRVSAKMTKRFIISDYLDGEYDSLAETYEEIKKSDKDISDGLDYLKKFRNSSQKSTYNAPVYEENHGSKQNFITNKISTFKTASRLLFKEIKLKYNARKNSYIRYNYRKFRSLFSTAVKKKLLSISRNKYLEYTNFFDRTIPEDYIFFTMHVQPEVSTSLYGAFFANQLHTIQNIARALPLHYKLVVKPHPLMLGKEPIKFYKEIKKIRNVVFIDPKMNTRNLIENSNGVITITGTSGLEALLLGKKVIVLGNPIYKVCDSVTKCTDFTKLKSHINQMEEYEPDDKDIAAYLQSVYNNSFKLENNIIRAFYRSSSESPAQEEKYREDIDKIYKELKMKLESL